MNSVIPMSYGEMRNALSNDLNYTVKIKGTEYSVPTMGAFGRKDRPGDSNIEIRLVPINAPGVPETNMSWSNKNIITIDDGINRLNPGDVVISYSSNYADDYDKSYNGGKRRRRNSKSKKRKSRRHRRKTMRRNRKH